MFQRTTTSSPVPSSSIINISSLYFSISNYHSSLQYLTHEFTTRRYSNSQLRLKIMHMNNKSAPSLYGTQWGPRYNNAPSKVVSIPVHFVGSERSNRIQSATKIQSVARGYLARKSVKKMVALKVELEEIEKNVNAPETVELMRKEQKERVRIGESIMNLLLKLDSVRVFHCSALRDFRKSLIKRAIALQELVDQFQTVGPTHQPQSTQGECDGVIIEEVNCLEKKEEVGCEGGNKREALMNEEKNEVEDGEGKCVGEESLVEEEDNCLVKEEEVVEKDDGEGEESVGTSLVEEEHEEGEIGCEEEQEEEENCKGGDGENREMLKRMMEDNEKMMEMMAQLFERNEMQTRLLTSLTQRVEQLERAFTCDKLRRKKRRNVDAKHKTN